MKFTSALALAATSQLARSLKVQNNMESQIKNQNENEIAGDRDWKEYLDGRLAQMESESTEGVFDSVEGCTLVVAGDCLIP